MSAIYSSILMKMKSLCQKYYVIFGLLAQCVMCTSTKSPFNSFHYPKTGTRLFESDSWGYDEEKHLWGIFPQCKSAYTELDNVYPDKLNPPTYNDLKKIVDIVYKAIGNDNSVVLPHYDDVRVSQTEAVFVFGHGLGGEDRIWNTMIDYLQVKFPNVIMLRYNVGYSLDDNLPSDWHEAVRQGLFLDNSLRPESRGETFSMSIEEQCEEGIQWLTEESWSGWSVKKKVVRKYPLVLIGHSQGGLRMSCMQEKLSAKGYNVAGLVTIGTPWKGASITQARDKKLLVQLYKAVWGPDFNGQGFQDLIPGNAFLKVSYERLQSTNVPTLLIAGDFLPPKKCLKSSFRDLFYQLIGSWQSDLIVSVDSQHAMGVINSNIERSVVSNAVHVDFKKLSTDPKFNFVLKQLEGIHSNDLGGLRFMKPSSITRIHETKSECENFPDFIGSNEGELLNKNLMKNTFDFLFNLLD